MAKRKLLSGKDPMRKKRSLKSRLMTTLNTSPRQERNVLNDSLLNLYKKDTPGCKNIDKNDTEEKNAENKIKENEVETSKTPSKSRRNKNPCVTPKTSSINFDSVGGMDSMLSEVFKMFLHFKDPIGFSKLGVSPRGILLHGPPGCGKTHIARAIAGELELPLLEVAATELVCGISGESESKIRDTFDMALSCGRCVLFIDEIDAICPKRETTDSAMMRRMVTQMIKCLDELFVKDVNAHVMVIGATNMPDSLDPALRRGLRFDQELAIGIPSEDARYKILQVICQKIKLSPDFDFQWLAHHTPGYVGADLQMLMSRAMRIGVSRMYQHLVQSSRELQPQEIIEQDCLENGDTIPVTKNPEVIDLTVGESDEIPLSDCSKLVPTVMSFQEERYWFKHFKIPDEEFEKLSFTMEDVQAALLKCVPYSKREGFASIPDITWHDIGALEDIKKQLRETIMWPVQYSKYYEENKISSTKGILLYGPKGCGKTLLAKAIANECSINFLSVNGPELLSMYVGESEKAVRKCFERARNSAPCVIFFDEFDALCPPRSTSNKDNAPVERVVNQLLTETDGMQERKQVFLVAATNRLDKIDSAMLRPGRLEKVLYVGLPNPQGRAQILESITKNKTRPKIEDELSLETIAFDTRCEDFSGADLAYLVREATTKAIEEMISSSSSLDNLVLCMRHFDRALEVVKPSFSEQDRKYFQKFLKTTPHSKDIINTL